MSGEPGATEAKIIVPVRTERSQLEVETELLEITEEYRAMEGLATKEEGVLKETNNINRFEIIAHKGGPGDGEPECTVEAFRKAKENGATILDTDFRMLTTREIVSFHGTDLTLTTDGYGNPEMMTWEEIQKLDAGFKSSEHRGKGYKIPLLKDVLNEFPDTTFVLHYQDQSEGTLEALVDLIKVTNSADRIIVAGFNDKPLREIKRLTGCKRGAGAREILEFYKRALLAKTGFAKPPTRDEFDFDYLTPGGEKASELNPIPSKLMAEGAALMDWARRYILPDKATVERCHELGIKFLVWTVDNEDELERWMMLGADGAWTNYPSRAHQVKKRLINAAV